MSFGTRLQQLRKDMNMTQKEFAELLEYLNLPYLLTKIIRIHQPWISLLRLLIDVMYL